MIAIPTISLTQARRAAIHAQVLDGRLKLPQGKAGAAQLIERLGYVQIDTLAVINRAHHHTLWTRFAGYRQALLDELLAQDRRVFEYWGHAASYLPMADYRYYLPLMQRYRSNPHGWAKRQGIQHRKLMAEVLARISSEGPLRSKDFAAPKGASKAWWGWKPAKAALELLFWRGDLMISSRHNFQRVYDLTERVLPDSVDTKMPSVAELGRFLVTRALRAYSVAEDFDICGHLWIAKRAVVLGALRGMVAGGEVIKVALDGSAGEYYTLADSLEAITRRRAIKPRLHLLSPFDNMVIQRRRLQRLFGFDYTIECYLPQAKRRYGYFCLPVLWGEQFVARLDPKADRKTKVFHVKSLHFEPGYKPDEEFLAALAKKLKQLAEFNNCQSVKLGMVNARGIKQRLAGMLKQTGD